MDASSPGPAAAAGPRRELTARALGAGMVIGAALAAGNVYTALKAAFMDGGAITAALLSFTFFAALRRIGGARAGLTQLETNIAQTTAASAAVAALAVGLSGAAPALHLMGRDLSPWLLLAWGTGLGVLGIGLGSLLRARLIDGERLPFPSGAATAEVIRTVHGSASAAVRRAALLGGAALAGGAITFLRDGPRAILPQAIYLPVTVGGLAASTLTLGVGASPLMAATGVFIGLRGAVSLLAGAILSWGILAPALHARGAVASTDYTAFVAWLIWPGLGLLASTTLTTLLADWRAVRATVRDLASLARRDRGGGGGAAAGGAGGRALAGLLTLAVASTVLIGWRAFQLHPAWVALILLASLLMSAVSARSAGETDIAPVGTMGMLAQILFGGRGAVASIMAGAVVTGQATGTAQSLWAYKAGHSLGASPRAQLSAQLAGFAVGAAVAIPVYILLVRAYGIGSERLPAPVALTWRATAEGIQAGIGGIPPGALRAFAAAFAAGAILGIVARWAPRTALARFLPSATAVGVGMLMPASVSAAAFVGAAAAAAVARLRPDAATDDTTKALAAGALAGESLTGVAIALALALG